MMPIRRGDGTGLSVPGFSELRKGDGTVLWSAAPDIPDSGVWQSLDSSAGFYEEYTTLYTFDSDDQTPQSLLDNRPAWTDETVAGDVGTTYTLTPPNDSSTDVYWQDDNSRKVAYTEWNGSYGGCVVAVNGPFDLSNADTAHYYMESVTGDNTYTLGMVLTTEGGTSVIRSQTIGQGGAADSFFDVSGLSGNHEVIYYMAGSTMTNASGKYADVYFE